MFIKLTRPNAPERTVLVNIAGITTVSQILPETAAELGVPAARSAVQMTAHPLDITHARETVEQIEAAIGQATGGYRVIDVSELESL